MKGSNIVLAIFILLIAAMFGGASYWVLQSAYISSEELDSYTGEVVWSKVVTETGPLRRDPTTGARERSSQDFFKFRLKDLHHTLAYYSTDHRYGKLSGAVQPGEVITVRYLAYENVSEYDVYEIEKGGTVILDGSGKRLTGKIFGFVLGVLALYFLVKTRSIALGKGDEEEPESKPKSKPTVKRRKKMPPESPSG